MLLTLLLVSMLIFFVFSIIPGDGVLSALGTNATPERVEAMRESLGLDQPVPVRFVNWMAGLFQGDLGTSIKYRQPVASLLGDKLTVTLWLALLSFALILCISVPLGIVISRYADRVPGRIAHVFIQLIMAVPSFFMGILLVLVFGLLLKWFTPYSYVTPSENFGRFLQSLLPAAVAIAIPKIAMVVRFLRGSVLEERRQDYVRTAYSKGAGTNRVYYIHILKNALIPVVTILGMMLTEIMAGSIVIEQVFNLPGLGRFLVSSIGNRDFPVVSVIMLYMAIVVVVLNSLVDILYHVIDPRISGT
jgi:ABC-type dipeptide/oligopeptide/nickel transport system permease component